MLKKFKKRLSVGEPLYFVNAADPRLDKRKSLELVDLTISAERAAWTVRTGSGELIEGRLRTAHGIPFLRDAKFCLSIPITLHMRGKSLAPDFVFEVPGSYIAVSDISEINL